MDTLIPPAFYHDPEVFQREQDIVLSSTWRCVGFVSQLANHNDYICRDVGGRSVVVQNFHGELRAFHNVCSHRFNRIQPTGTGNRPLQCSYHGWTYNAEGIPSTIPKRPRFDNLTPEKICSLRLTAWAVETCGKLVFVCRQTGGPSLADFLGDTAATIEVVSNACGPLIDENEMTIGANWKVLVENTLESYHVGFIHPDTFSRLNTGEGTFAWQGPHSSWSAPLGPKFVARMDKLNSLFESRPWRTPGYFHQLIFPNLTLATTQGTSFSIQFFEPASPTVTRFTSYVFQAQLSDLSEGAREAVTALNSSVKEFNRAVFSEDKGVCEDVQRGAAETAQPGILSDEELRVGAFQTAYMKLMNPR